MYTPKDIYIYTLKELLMYIKKWILYVYTKKTLLCIYYKEHLMYPIKRTFNVSNKMNIVIYTLKELVIIYI